MTNINLEQLTPRPAQSGDTNVVVNRNSRANRAYTKLDIINVNQLRTTEPSFPGQQVNLLGHTTDGIGGGELWYDSSDTTTADNGGTVFVTVSGARWKRKS